MITSIQYHWSNFLYIKNHDGFMTLPAPQKNLNVPLISFDTG